MSDLVYFKKSKLNALADKINEKCGGVEPLSLDEMVDKIDEISSADSDSSLSEFLSKKSNLKYLYQNYSGNNFIKFTINSNARDMSFCYEANTNLIYWNNICDTSLITNFLATFQSCSKLKEINGLNTHNAQNVQYTFNACLALETIAKPLDFSKVANTYWCFNLCRALKNIEFVAETIKVSLSFANSDKLTAKSVQSIIDGLATVTTAQTITFNKAIALSDEQKQTINDKGWTLVQA